MSESSKLFEAEEQIPTDIKTAQVIAVVLNPFSGERVANRGISTAVVQLYGSHNVLTLSGESFRDPSGLVKTLEGNLARRVHQCYTGEIKSSKKGGNSEMDQTAGGEDDAMTRSIGRPLVLVAGGDGTMAFALQIIDTMKLPRAFVNDPINQLDCSPEDSVPVPEHWKASIAILPLGTGNDMARSAGVGGGISATKCCVCCVCCPNKAGMWIDKALAPPVRQLDRWHIVMTEISSGKVLVDQLFTNYFSAGLDAETVYRFDARRRASPSLHKMRCGNKIWYAWHGLVVSTHSRKITRKNFEVKSGDGTPIPLPSSSQRGFCVMNVKTYAGGSDMWQIKKSASVRVVKGKKVQMVPSSPSDGKLELVTLNGATHMLMIRSGIRRGNRMGQGDSLDVEVKTPMYFQVDGEALGKFKGPLRIQINQHPLTAWIRWWPDTIKNRS